jgi:hypothetical protein
MSIRSLPARKRISVVAFMAVALMAGAMLALQSARAADHRDAPGIEGSPAADINDVYAFRSPTNNDNLVVAVTVNPLTAPAQNASVRFASDVSYNIHVDNTGDLVADATVTVRFNADGTQFTIGGLGDPITGPVTGGLASSAIVTESGPIKAFAGLRDDPFFFDLVGFKAFTSGPYTPAAGLRQTGTPADTFAGTNVSAIVIELPIVALTGQSASSTGVIKAWATTSRGGTQLDRMAIPAINTALIPSGMKDAFNAGTPATDEAMFRATAQATIEGLRAAVAPFLGDESGGPLGNVPAAGVAAALIPDIVTIDFASPVAFPNGRRLQDDVIDAALGIVLNRGGAAGISDGIGANDKAFLDAFPFLAAPHQAPPPGAPATGSGLASQDDGFNAAALGAILAAVGAVALLGFAARRRFARN